MQIGMGQVQVISVPVSLIWINFFHIPSLTVLAKGQWFYVRSWRKLENWNQKKPPSLEELDLFFCKTLSMWLQSHISNLSLHTANLWCKGGKQTDPNCYRPFGIRSCQDQVLQSYQLTSCLKDCGILSSVQLAFRSTTATQNRIIWKRFLLTGKHLIKLF